MSQNAFWALVAMNIILLGTVVFLGVRLAGVTRSIDTKPCSNNTKVETSVRGYSDSEVYDSAVDMVTSVSDDGVELHGTDRNGDDFSVIVGDDGVQMDGNILEMVNTFKGQ